MEQRLAVGRRLVRAVAPAITGLLAFASWGGAGKAAPPTVDPAAYAKTVRPLLDRYCRDCHAGKRTEADLDLGTFPTFAEVRRHARTWQKIGEMLDSRQMPPKESPQPSDADRAVLQKWVREFLTAEAAALAGDPGPVVLRRLTVDEYAYTVRDLTGVESLNPTREFPVDGAAGEGFVNTGGGQGMSPALVQKYLDAAKEVASHAVLLPDGLRFSAAVSRRDRTDEYLGRIQSFYRRFTKDGGGTAVNLHGIVFSTNQGGLLPLDRYLAATLAERDALRAGSRTIEAVAQERSLSPKYLGLLWRTLDRPATATPSPFLDRVRTAWRAAKPEDAPRLASEIEAMAKPLWKFNPVGQVGRPGGPQSWMEPLSPFVTSQPVKLKLPPDPNGPDVVVNLTVGDQGDGAERDFVVWQRPRIEIPAAKDRPARTILLKDLRSAAKETPGTIASDAGRAAEYLSALASLTAKDAKSPAPALAELAAERKLDPAVLQTWAALIPAASSAPAARRDVSGLFTSKLTRVGGHETVAGWGSPQTPNLLANRSDKAISLGTPQLAPRSVTVHPSPLAVAFVAWRSPLAGTVAVTGHIADADAKCGNGFAWRVERRGASGTEVLANGAVENGKSAEIRVTNPVTVGREDFVVLVIDALDRSHICDSTRVDLTIAETGGMRRTWDLAKEVVDRIAEGNPLPDASGNAGTWHFGAEPTSGPAAPSGPVVVALPSESSLAKWRAAVGESRPAAEIALLAQSVQQVLTAEDAGKLSDADRVVRSRLLFGLESDSFGRHPAGAKVEPVDVCVQAPRTLAVRLPARLVAGAEFVTTAVVHPEAGPQATVQTHAALGEGGAAVAIPAGTPVLVAAGDAAGGGKEAALKEFRDLFPPALCYARIVPVDEVVTLTLFHREDGPLRRLMLDEAQSAELERLWDEFYYISREPLQLVVALEQLIEFATQDRQDLVNPFKSMQPAIAARADAFRQRLVDTEPAHLAAALEFAGRAWRRPLSESEKKGLRDLYRTLRAADTSHEEAMQSVLARVLASPAFLYKLETPPAGTKAAPVSDLELATRLSYFLWSSAPDEELRRTAQSGRLKEPDVLRAQARRMLRDPRTRRLAVQFACQWLHVRDFDRNDDKNEKLFPEFAALRSDMYEETVRFFEHLFREDGSILDVLDADFAYVNPALAKLYGLPQTTGPGWQRIDGMKSRGRGGVLGMATILASQSGASRTSPILRGNWVHETLLGERLPRPPAGVPQLPETVPQGLTERELIEKHSSVAACAKCHVRIDPYGFALEQYDPIGRLRPAKVDVRTTLFDGTPVEGLEGLRTYLSTTRRDDFVRQFCRKALGFALGREVRLSDEPLLAEMRTRLAADGFRFGTLVDLIVASRQFREIRGAEDDSE